MVFTSHDRAGHGVLSSRLGLQAAAIEVHDELDFWAVLTDRLATGGKQAPVLARAS